MTSAERERERATELEQQLADLKRAYASSADPELVVSIRAEVKHKPHAQNPTSYCYVVVHPSAPRAVNPQARIAGEEGGSVDKPVISKRSFLNT